MTVREIINKLSEFNPDFDVLISVTKNDEVIKDSIDIEVFQNWDKTIHISTDEESLI